MCCFINFSMRRLCGFKQAGSPTRGDPSGGMMLGTGNDTDSPLAPHLRHVSPSAHLRERTCWEDRLGWPWRCSTSGWVRGHWAAGRRLPQRGWRTELQQVTLPGPGWKPGPWTETISSGLHTYHLPGEGTGRVLDRASSSCDTLGFSLHNVKLPLLLACLSRGESELATQSVVHRCF